MSRPLVPQALKAGDEVICFNLGDNLRVISGETYIIQIVNHIGCVLAPKYSPYTITTLFGKDASFIVIRKVSK